MARRFFIEVRPSISDMFFLFLESLCNSQMHTKQIPRGMLVYSPHVHVSRETLQNSMFPRFFVSL